MSWAAIARKDAEVVAESIVNWADEKPRVAVVDANAIISGLTLHGIAERAVTIQVELVYAWRCFLLAIFLSRCWISILKALVFCRELLSTGRQ